MLQHLPQSVLGVSLAHHPLAPQAVDQPIALVGVEPACLFGAVSEIEYHDETEQNCRNTLADKQPLPAPQPPDPVHAEDQPG